MDFGSNELRCRRCGTKVTALVMSCPSCRGDLTQPGAHWSEYDEWRDCYHRGFVRFVLIERMGIGWIISICAMGASYFLGASITNTFGGVFVKMLSAPLMMLAIGWCQWRALQREFGGQCPPDDSSHSSQRSE